MAEIIKQIRLTNPKTMSTSEDNKVKTAPNYGQIILHGVAD
jgi:hypothetical protein